MNELLDFTVKFLQTNPEKHKQSLWFEGEVEESGTHVADMNVCGTTGCVAGWGAIFGGWHQVRPHMGCVDSDPNVECDHEDELRYDVVVDETGHMETMANAAKESFGLTQYQANVLFAGYNDMDRIERIVEDIQAGRMNY